MYGVFVWSVAVVGAWGGWKAATVVVATTILAPVGPVPLYPASACFTGPGSVTGASTDVPAAWSASTLVATYAVGNVVRRSFGRSD